MEKNQDNSQPLVQFSLKSVMVVVTCWAVALACARLVVPPKEMPGFMAGTTFVVVHFVGWFLLSYGGQNPD